MAIQLRYVSSTAISLAQDMNNEMATILSTVLCVWTHVSKVLCAWTHVSKVLCAWRM